MAGLLLRMFEWNKCLLHKVRSLYRNTFNVGRMTIYTKIPETMFHVEAGWVKYGADSFLNFGFSCNKHTPTFYWHLTVISSLIDH